MNELPCTRSSSWYSGELVMKYGEGMENQPSEDQPTEARPSEDQPSEDQPSDRQSDPETEIDPPEIGRREIMC